MSNSVTATATSYYTVYPNGRHLESVGIPLWLPSYPVSRISSACSCLSLPKPITTITMTQSTQIKTTTTTQTTTLSGVCATQPSSFPNPLNYTIPHGTYSVNLAALFSISNPYDCCTECQNPNMYIPTCIFWIGGPGTCKILYTLPSPTAAVCGDGDITVFEDGVLAPDNLGGVGRYAGAIAVKTGK